MADKESLLSQLIDDYVAWFAAWHHVTMSQQADPVPPPSNFVTWKIEAVKSFSNEQPAIEHLNALHEQLHKLVKLVLMRAPEGRISSKDDESIAVKYLELMRELRRFERAFATAAADLDPLTGLHTRVSLVRDMEREISRSSRTKRPFFVAIMDIDHFKKINDTYGHESGDRVLASIGNQISKGLRAHDDAYRLGGEEFLICLKETESTGASIVLERLRSGIEKTSVTAVDGRTLNLTASFGFTSSTTAATPDALLRIADEALYRAKKEGRNRVIASQI